MSSNKILKVKNADMQPHLPFVNAIWFSLKCIMFCALALLTIIILGCSITPHVIHVYEKHYTAPYDENDLKARFAATYGLEINPGKIPPVDTVFHLEASLTSKQLSFFRYYGFIRFERALLASEVQTLLSERQRIEKDLLVRNVTSIRGVPIFQGTCENGRKCLTRIPFTSTLSDSVRNVIRNDRFDVVKDIVVDAFGLYDDEKSRTNSTIKKEILDHSISEANKSSLWSRKMLGWHTDALRDIAYLRRPSPMLNFGIHLDKVSKFNGDAVLCLLPKTHSLLGFMFRKIYFISNDDNEETEICVSTFPGDVTVHDGRLWHRVKGATHGKESIRRTAYVPYLTDTQPYEPKSKESSTPFYHYFGMIQRWIKGGK
eukprot:GSMAST32.ASY1.ANO1.12.1 assembled CDS